MKIAIASSGLGHVARGVEAWAGDTAEALSQLSVKGYQLSVAGNTNNQQPITENHFTVTLFAAAPLPHLGTSRAPAEESEQKHAKSAKEEILVSAGLSAVAPEAEGGNTHPPSRASVQIPLSVRVLPCLKRGDRMTRLIVRLSPKWTWRWGWTSPYDIEQRSFWRRLWPILRDEGYDILHVQDPLLADLCRRYRKAGKLKTREILAHGTEETVEFLERFDYLQELTPQYAARHKATRKDRLIGVAPNFVDTTLFAPGGERKAECRRKLGLPPDAFVVLSVGSINRGRKRMDYMVSEFARWPRADAVLVIAGACDNSESQALVAEARRRLGARLVILTDLARDRMPDVYAASDVFVLCAMRELFGIAFLEAMACGVPCIGHRYPVTEWVIGDGGGTIDMSLAGSLVETLESLTPEWVAQHGRQARERVLAMFSKDVVIGQYVEYYKKVMGDA